MFRIIKECIQNFSLLHTMILVIHHLFLNKSGSPLVCFHPIDFKNHVPKLRFHGAFIWAM